MAIPKELTYTGNNKEFQFRDKFIMPLLLRLGFGVVLNYHGSREFGRDVIFGDIDRFGHVNYFGMQIKYEPSISLSASTELIEDAQQATHNAFTHPATGKQEYISGFYVANAGGISEQARANFFSGVTRHAIRDARLLDGNALLLLDNSSAANRNSHIKERLAGLAQEARRNIKVTETVESQLVSSLDGGSVPTMSALRLRSVAAAAYLAAPFPIEGLNVEIIDLYFEFIRAFNRFGDNVGVAMGSPTFRIGSANNVIQIGNELRGYGLVIAHETEKALAAMGPASTGST